MAYTTINNGKLYFDTKLYTGTGSAMNITGVEFQPDMTWIKPRSAVDNHILYDAVRGVTKILRPNLTLVEGTVSDMVTAFNSDGVSLGTNGNVTANGVTFAAWNWKAGTGQGSSNTDGSINTTYTSVNTTAGFSISKYTATGSNATVGHGLGVAPAMVILKNLDSARSWTVGHNGLTNWNYHLYLSSTNAENSDSTMFQGTAPSSTVFSVGTASETNESGDNFIAYCFAEKQGYSKFGNYQGNGNADGTFVYLGFKPAFVIIKKSGDTANWNMYDNERSPFNLTDELLRPDETDSEIQSDGIDLLSNGFKARATNAAINTGGSEYIYMAFAENPFTSSTGTPVTAR